MGCAPTKARNLQLQSPRIQTEIKPNTSERQQQNNKIETQKLVTQLYHIITSEHIQIQEKKSLFLKKLQNNGEAKCMSIADYQKRLLGQRDVMSQESLEKMLIVSNYIVEETVYHKGYQNLSKNQINAIGEFMKRTNNQLALDSCAKFTNKMFLGYDQRNYSKCEVLFQAIIHKFLEFSSDQIREEMTQNLVEMMEENPKLLEYANDPYYFIQFWLYTINKCTFSISIETSLERQLYWIERVKKIYSSDKIAEEKLFYDNDFKVFIDVLVRVLYACPDGQALRIPLECYLVLSHTKKMQKLLRLDDIKQYIQQINGDSLGVAELFAKINQLK